MSVDLVNVRIQYPFENLCNIAKPILLLHQAYISSVLHPYDSWERVPCHNIPHDPDFCGATLPCDLGGVGLDPAENYKYPVWYRET